jgi:hypothetical protein
MAYPQAPGGVAPQKKPSKTGIIWAIVIFAVTAIVGIVMIVLSIGTIASAIDDLQQVDAGETKELTLTPGDQYIFVGADSRRDLLDVRVTIDDPDGNSLRPRSGNDYSSNNNGEQFESIGYIDVQTTGTYTVTVEGPPGSSVRIGEIPIGRFLGLLIGGIVIGALGFIVALVVLIVALVRRSRVKKENRLAAWGPPQHGYGQPAPPSYGQPAPAPPAPAAPAYGQPAPPTPPPPGPSTPPPPPPPGPSSPPPGPSSSPPGPSSSPPPPPPG